MNKFFAVSVLICSLATGYAQTTGVIECNGRSSVSSFETPESIIVINQLSCGQTVDVLGVEEDFVKVRISKYVVAYVPVEHIRFLEKGPETGPIVRESIPESKPDRQETPSFKSPSKPPVSEPAGTRVSSVRTNGEFKPISGFEIGVDSSYIMYEEPGLMEEKGPTFSLYAAYTSHPKNFMIRFAGRVGFGTVDYSSPISGTADGIRDYITEARFLFGRDFKVSNTWYLTPFSGLGYRFLFDGLGEKTTDVGHLGYDRNSNYLYSPIGIESANYLNDNWSVVAAGEYDYFWHGWQYSDLDVLLDGDSFVLNEQEKGWGVRASGKFIRKADKYGLVFGPYFKYWNIEDSNETSVFLDEEEIVFIEPANTSVEIGGKFGVIF